MNKTADSTLDVPKQHDHLGVSLKFLFADALPGPDSNTHCVMMPIERTSYQSNYAPAKRLLPKPISLAARELPVLQAASLLTSSPDALLLLCLLLLSLPLLRVA